jgi:dolichol-phosphate mannosyltransferase
MARVTLVAPCYNEAEVLDQFYARIRRLPETVAGHTWEFLFVDDGSNDATGPLLDRLAGQDPRVRVLHLARNRGHQIALTAGMDFATGDIIVTLDADLQDPPEVVATLLRKITEGYDLVHAQRRSRAGETWFKLWTARAFYRLLRAFSTESLVENCGDFRAFTRPVLVAASSFRERHRFLRGTFASLGFRQAVISYDRAPRLAGKTKFPLKHMIRLALDGVLSFSPTPLRSVLWLALAFWAVSLLFVFKALVGHFILGRTVPGWTSLVALLTFFTGLNLFCLSVIGAYIGRIFEQGQGRPLYWCSYTKNVDLDAILRDGGQAPEVALARIISRVSAPRGNDDEPPPPQAG